MKFISATERVYNLEIRKTRKINSMLKIDKTLDKDIIEKLVSIITAWSICKFSNTSKQLYGKSNVLKLLEEDEKLLLQIFDKNNLLNNLEKVLEKKDYEKLSSDDTYRRNIMFLSLLQIIIQGGKTYGAEYGLVFAKINNFDLAIPMHYASYEKGMADPRLKKYIEIYLKSGGSEYVYWLPKYYSEDKKNKYNMEELEYVMNFLQITNDKQKKLV